MVLPQTQLFERFNNVDCAHANGFDGCYGQNWMSNVFKVGLTGPNIDHITTGVRIYIYRGDLATAGTLTAFITTTKIATGILPGLCTIPTETIVASGTIPKSDIPPSVSNPLATWVEIIFDKTGWLRKDTSYALVVKSSWDGWMDTTSWAYNYSCPLTDPFSDYSLGGERVSANEGLTWDFIIGQSCLFEEYGTITSASMNLMDILSLRI